MGKIKRKGTSDACHCEREPGLGKQSKKTVRDEEEHNRRMRKRDIRKEGKTPWEVGIAQSRVKEPTSSRKGTTANQGWRSMENKGGGGGKKVSPGRWTRPTKKINFQSGGEAGFGDMGSISFGTGSSGRQTWGREKKAIKKRESS